MIFPQLPKRYVANDPIGPQAPLREIAATVEKPEVDIEAWWIKHGLATDPAAGLYRSSNEPIDYWSKDALEFYALCTAIVCWIAYWYGVHRGLW